MCWASPISPADVFLVQHKVTIRPLKTIMWPEQGERAHEIFDRQAFGGRQES
jgi:hypothetical protein